MDWLRTGQVSAMVAGGAVYLHLSDGTVALTSPRLGCMPLPRQLAQRSAELVYLQQEHEDGDANMPVALTEQELCACLLLNSRLLPEGVAEQAVRLLPDSPTGSEPKHGAEHAAEVRCQDGGALAAICPWWVLLSALA